MTMITHEDELYRDEAGAAGVGIVFCLGCVIAAGLAIVGVGWWSLLALPGSLALAFALIARRADWVDWEKAVSAKAHNQAVRTPDAPR